MAKIIQKGNKIIVKVHEGVRIWDYEDAWRILRHTHLRSDLYKEVFKCPCGKIIRVPEKVEAKIDRINNISFNLTCDCGDIITIKCDTLVIEKGFASQRQGVKDE